MARQQVNLEWRVGEEGYADIGGTTAVDGWRAWTPQMRVTSATRISGKTNAGYAVARARAMTQPDGTPRPRSNNRLSRGTSGQPAIDEHWLIGRLLLALLIGFCGLLIGSSVDTSSAARTLQQARGGVLGTLALEEEAWQNNDVDLLNSIVSNRVNSRWVRIWLGQWNTLVAERADFATAIVDISMLDGTALDRTAANQGAAQNGGKNNTAIVTVRVNRPPVEWWQSSPYLETRFYQATSKAWLRTLPPTKFWGEQYTIETTHLRFEYHARDAQSIEPMIGRIEAIYGALHDLLGVQPAAGAEKLTLAIKPDRVRIWASYGDQVEITSPILAQIPEGLSSQEYVALQFINELTYPIIAKTRRQYSGSNLRRWDFVIWGLRGWLSTQLLGYRTPWQHEAEARFRQQAPERLPLDLTDIAYWRYSRAHFMWQSVAVESLISYVVDTHGLETLPELVRGFNQYRQWEELIDHVYGVSVAEFMAAWNSYVRERYDIRSASEIS